MCALRDVLAARDPHYGFYVQNVDAPVSSYPQLPAPLAIRAWEGGGVHGVHSSRRRGAVVSDEKVFFKASTEKSGRRAWALRGK